MGNVVRISHKLAVVSLFLLVIPARIGQSAEPISSDSVFTAEEIAAAKKDPKLCTLDPSSIKITKKAPIYRDDADYLAASSKVNKIEKNPLVVIGEIVNIGLKIWDIIEKNAPVVDISSQYASALPRGIETWSQLAGWNHPVGHLYSFSAENFYGMTWVDVEYKVLYTSGGSYEGKGKYLTGVTIVPTKVDVNWGTRVSLSAEVPDSTVVNIGTTDNPVAALQLVLTSSIRTVVSNINSTNAYYITAHGYMEEIAGRFAAPKAADIKSAKPLLDNQSAVFESGDMKKVVPGYPQPPHPQWCSNHHGFPTCRK